MISEKRLQHTHTNTRARVNRLVSVQIYLLRKTLLRNDSFEEESSTIEGFSENGNAFMGKSLHIGIWNGSHIFDTRKHKRVIQNVKKKTNKNFKLQAYRILETVYCKQTFTSESTRKRGRRQSDKRRIVKCNDPNRELRKKKAKKTKM